MNAGRGLRPLQADECLKRLARHVEDHSGWSAVVSGRAEGARHGDDLAALRDVPLRPWAPGVRDRYLHITSTAITGRDLA